MQLNGEDGSESPGRDRDAGRNTVGPTRADLIGPPAPVEQGDERWGFLPVHVREVFRNQGDREIPIIYRDWIDAYHRKLLRSQ